MRQAGNVPPGMRRGGGPPYFFGVALLTLGILFLLNNLNLLEARGFIRTWWPALIIAWGSSRLLWGWAMERFIGAGAVVFGTVLLGNRLFDWDIHVWQVLWPLAMIALGLHVLLHRRHQAEWTPPPPSPPSPHAGATPPVDTPPPIGAAPPYDAPPPPLADAPPPLEGFATSHFSAQTDRPDPDHRGDDPHRRVDTSASFKEVAVMAGIERRNVSQALRGGEVTVVMGGVEIDLRDSRMAADEARVTVSVVMGEAVLRVPRDWTVESRVSATFANFEDRTAPPLNGASKRFIIEGSTFMGNVEIRN
jgi:hypothetical protein